ncbi:type II secretion system F family protein [Melghirimyces algeriensis]|uniref:Type II secretion system protein F (GspF) n=1 Tax=Melghirimyces algeriensis TaxID=910412 RepID=A0A521BQE4_9BACL|nr:type II secretion system F family protein [Melghirimyces algeriensis]SMO49366.1 type II secretion system protein F (GspF) [Melghirimyces algeriensis]
MNEWKRRKWNADRLSEFSRHLSHLLDAGFPLVPSIRLLSEQRVIRPEEAERVLRCLDQGMSLSVALKQEGFPSLFISFIQAAEEYGDYGFGLKQCHAYYREKGRFIRELTRSLTYPLIVFLLVILSLLFLMTTVVPRFSEMYETMGLTLPLYTRIFISIHGSLRVVLYSVGGVCAIGFLLYLVSRRLPSKIRGRWTAPVYALPLIRSYFALRFTHYLAIQLGSLLQSGVPLLKAMEIMESLTPWNPLQKGLFRVRERLLAGESLYRSLEQEGALFLPSLHRLVALGEESGSLEKSFLSLAQGTEMLIKDRLDRLTQSLEPVLIFFIGILMVATVLALFLPMLHLVRAV